MPDKKNMREITRLRAKIINEVIRNHESKSRVECTVPETVVKVCKKYGYEKVDHIFTIMDESPDSEKRKIHNAKSTSEIKRAIPKVSKYAVLEVGDKLNIGKFTTAQMHSEYVGTRNYGKKFMPERVFVVMTDENDDIIVTRIR